MLLLFVIMLTIFKNLSYTVKFQNNLKLADNVSMLIILIN